MKKDYEISNSTQDMIYALLLFIFIILALNVLYTYKGNLLISSFYMGSYIALSGIRHFFFRKKRLRYAFVIIEAVIISSFMFIVKPENAIFVLLVMTADIITGFNLKFALPVTITTFCLYLAAEIIGNAPEQATSEELTPFVLVRIASFLLVFLIMVFYKKQYIQNLKMKDLIVELKDKTIQLEQLATVKERNRIAGEIHDTVGHTLTAVLVTLEAGRMVVQKDQKKALESMETAREQVKKGLNEIRDSVKAIKSGHFLQDTESAILSTLKEMEKDLNISIKHCFNVNKPLSPMQCHFFLRIIQEAVTNGIRHGNASKFDLSLQQNGGFFEMSIQDNGKGTDRVTPGFGLNNMMERVRAIQGILETSSEPGNGFCISVKLPVESGDME